MHLNKSILTVIQTRSTKDVVFVRIFFNDLHHQKSVADPCATEISDLFRGSL